MITLLGTAQDGGRPQVGCVEDCCKDLSHDESRWPVSLGILDKSGRGHIIDTSRHLGEQLRLWYHPPLASVLLTHAHFGHTDGLGLLGRETMNLKGIDLHVSASMHELIEKTPQWAIMQDQGVFSTHIFCSGKEISLGLGLIVEPIEVPHRAELSDMHAFVIRGPSKSLLYLPDHDSWKDTLQAHGVSTMRDWFTLLRIDIALLDGTFWSYDELPPNRQQGVPHPPVKEQIKELGVRRASDPEIYFIHLNHTNPLNRQDSDELCLVRAAGWDVCTQGQQFIL